MNAWQQVGKPDLLWATPAGMAMTSPAWSTAALRQQRFSSWLTQALRRVQAQLTWLHNLLHTYLVTPKAAVRSRMSSCRLATGRVHGTTLCTVPVRM